MISKSDLFRQHHFLILRTSYDLERGSADFFASSYFRKHPQLGSKDRAYISGLFFRYLRMKSLIDALHTETKESVLALLEQNTDSLLAKAEKYPPHIRLSVPLSLYECIHQSWKEKADEIIRANLFEAPLYIRVNPIRTTRAELKKKLSEAGIESDEEPDEFALRLRRRANLFSLPIFQEGWFEVQDAGSQAISRLVQPRRKQKVLDYCAGSGGKSLGFAHLMQGQGQLFLHDIRKEALLEAKKRLRRAGIQNVQYVHADEVEKMKVLQGACDWVLVDAPCSGTGTHRRNPDMKWKFSLDMLHRLVKEQREIFEKALFSLKPNGRIVYATCSILSEENQAQIEFFQKMYGLELVGPVYQTYPTEGGMDGFFAAVLRRV